MKASENKYLTVRPGVVLTPTLEDTICLLDPWFENHNLKAIVTSGVRTYDEQLRIIKQRALACGLGAEHPDLAHADLNTPIMFDGKLIPMWQLVWSEALVRGQMVNPPTPTACLFPYTKPDGGKRAAGNIVPTSPHQRERAFDIGGGNSLDSVVVVVSEAFISKTIPTLAGYLKEPAQGCCHCDVRIL